MALLPRTAASLSLLKWPPPCGVCTAVSFFVQSTAVSTSVVARKEAPLYPPTTRAQRDEWSCGSTNAVHPERAVSIAGPTAKVIVWRERASAVLS